MQKATGSWELFKKNLFLKAQRIQCAINCEIQRLVENIAARTESFCVQPELRLFQPRVTRTGCDIAVSCCRCEIRPGEPSTFCGERHNQRRLLHLAHNLLQPFSHRPEGAICSHVPIRKTL